MACSAVLETITLGMVALFASAVSDPSAVIHSVYMNSLREVFSSEWFDTSKEMITNIGLVVVCLVGLKNCVKALVTYWIARFGVSVEAYFGEMLLKGFLTLPYQWHLTRNSADLVNAIQWRTYMGRYFLEPCLKVFDSTMMVFLMLTALLIVQPLVSLVVIGVIGSTAYLIFRVVRIKIDRVAAIARDYDLMINKEATMAIHGIKDVKIAQKEDAFILRFLKNALPLAKITGIQRFYGESPALILETTGFAMLTLSLSLVLAVYDTSTAYITGTIALLAVTAWKALPALALVLSSSVTIRNALPYISHQIGYLNEMEASAARSVHGLTDSEDPLFFSRELKFDGVGFSYDPKDEETLKDICFRIKRGEIIGVIGKSGAGKSTLIDLLIGLLEPGKGSIMIDNMQLHSNNISQWLSIIGYVPQSPYIYDGTLAENVAFGADRDTIDRQRVLECCSMAAMDDFIHDMRDGVDSFIGERGIRLSGGQQQRVAIARALYKHPEVMIFDEATSSLDNKSEKSIQDTIYSFKGKQTLIIIAHRLTTVRECDRLIWLDKGRIKMQGKPEDVLKEYNQVN